MAEKIIYQSANISITTSKVGFGGTTYFLRNIASVRVTKSPNGLSLMLVLGGLTASMLGSCFLPDTWYVVLAGIGMILVSIKLGLYLHHLIFDTSSGSVQAHMGKPAELNHLKEQIEQAMVESQG
jgi:hypothetical protein